MIRTWILNENSVTKIRGQDFPLVPDYASGAFMIQGATLAASIADFSDVHDFGGLSGLLQWHAFSHESRSWTFSHACIPSEHLPNGRTTRAVVFIDIMSDAVFVEHKRYEDEGHVVRVESAFSVS